MKKTLWFIIAVFTFFSIILYLGNVFIIGDQISRIFIFFRIPSDVFGLPNFFLWDIILGILPIIFLFLYIAKSIFSYGELNVDALLESKDERQVLRVLKSIAEQPPESTLDKYNLRDKCQYVLSSGDCIKHQAFLKEYYTKCEEETKNFTGKYAVLAAVSVIISPKSAGDTVALLVWQCRIISSILKIYGGRPSKTMVLRLYAKVLMHSFVAGSIDEVFDQFAVGMDIKGLSFLTQAVAALATCVRTASLTRYYIRHGMECDRGKKPEDSIRTEIIAVIQSKEFKAALQKCIRNGIEASKTIAVELGKYGIESAQELGKYAISNMIPGAKETENTSGQDSNSNP